MFMDEAGLPEESHESLKVNDYFIEVSSNASYAYIGATLSLG